MERFGADATLHVEIPRLQLDIDVDEGSYLDEEQLKSLLWEQHKESIYKAIRVQSQKRAAEANKAHRRRCMLDTISRVQREFIENQEVS
jgi:hypothetical protein